MFIADDIIDSFFPFIAHDVTGTFLIIADDVVETLFLHCSIDTLDGMVDDTNMS